jgi:hypothetical protein
VNRIGRLTRLAVLLAPTLVLSACVHVPMERDRTQTALSEAPAANAPFVSMDKGPFRDDPCRASGGSSTTTPSSTV